MAEARRNLWVAAGLVVVLAAGAAVLPSTGWTCALAVLLGLVGVVLLRGNGWRSGALLIAAIAVAVGLLDLFAGLVAPQAHGVGLVTTFEPHDWIVPDPDLGYRPRPDSRVSVTSSYGDETIYRATYTILPDGTRATPPAPPGADIYLFMGDSFMFGQGLPDDETLPAQFARANDFRVRTIDFAAPGYAPNQLVRALEAGRFDALKGETVKAVVTWIIPAHLARVTGDEPWLGSSPRYVLEDGKPPRFTGSFDAHRWRDPVDGLRHLADQQFPFVAALGARQREAHQAALFTALVVRLRDLVREKFNAPLLVLYSWPDESSPAGFDNTYMAQPLLVSILQGLRARGLSLLPAGRLTAGVDPAKLLFPHEGHPTAFADHLTASDLKARLMGGP
jgi:hypothetical protein